jgi:uncharacterized small protein (DUF1192 family)
LARQEDEVWGAPPKSAIAHTVGEPLDALSIAELDRRIGVLRDEILRLERARAEKEASRSVADAAFRSSSR